MVGAGAANMAIARLFLSAGVNPETMVMTDRSGTLYAGRDNLTEEHKLHMARTTNKEKRKGGVAEALQGADVLVACSRPGPGTIKKESIANMASDAIVFACANPIPEIWPWEAKEAGARIVGTGRSDFPNQVNNSLGFPGIFRGALDVRAKTITDEMCIAAAQEMASCAEDKGLTDDYIVPTMDEWELFPREAAAVGLKAIEQGIARIQLTREELLDHASHLIKRVQDTTKKLMKEGIIPPAPEDE
jgi:malate dehydrogenase (oxaloacetate-decarboxylating)